MEVLKKLEQDIIKLEEDIATLERVAERKRFELIVKRETIKAISESAGIKQDDP